MRIPLVETMRIIVVAAAVCIFGGIACAQSSPPQVDPASLPARDHHEGVLIAANPCADAARAKEIFGSKNPVSAGILPIEVYLRNETDQLIRVDLDTMRLDVVVPDGPRQHISALSVEQVAGNILHPAGAGDPDSARKHIPRPIPMPTHDKSQEKLIEKIRPLALENDMVPPHGTIHGFLFFDLGHDFSVLHDATLYVPDVVVVPTHHGLTYFELNLSAAAH